MVITLQINDDFGKVIYCDVISSVIYLLNKVEYLEKEESYRNSTKEVKLSFQGYTLVIALTNQLIFL